MPIIKQNFELDFNDCLKLQKAISNIGIGAESAINECLKNKTSIKMAKSITNFLPRSETGKHHAKDNNWYELEFYNLSFILSNSLAGKRENSFYYLYYPATGTGQSYKKGPNDFMGNGMKSEYNNAVSDLLNALNKKIEEDLNYE